MTRYLRIIFHLFKFSQVNFLEYRADFILTWFGDAFIALTLIVFFGVIYGQTSSLAGWSRGEVFLLLAVVGYIEGLIYFLYLDSIQRISKLLPRGDLDIYLTKPVDFQFLMTFGKISPNTLGPIVPAMLLTVAGIQLLQPENLFIKLVAFFILLFCAIVVHYSFILSLTSISLFTTRLEAVMHLDGRLRDLARQPLDIYPKYLRYLFFSILPVAFFGYLPVQVFRSDFSYYLAVYAVIFAGLVLYLSRKFFYFALRHYSSASS